MGSQKNLKYFTEELRDLVSENLSLYESLSIIGNSKLCGRNVRKGSLFLSEKITSGQNFSSALRICPFLHFDETYVAFITLSETTGNLLETLKFLCNRLSRREENKSALIQAMAYPLFVVVLALFMITALIYFAKKRMTESFLFASLGISVSDVFRSLCSSLAVFSISVYALIFFFGKKLGENKIYEAFMSGSFFLNHGLSLSNAVGMAALTCGVDSSSGKLFRSVRENLEYGMDLRNAFFQAGESYKDRKLIREIERYLLVADATGDKNQVFNHVAENLRMQNEKKRKVYLHLMEPAFIMVVGIFILNLVFTLILPALDNVTLIQGL